MRCRTGPANSGEIGLTIVAELALAHGGNVSVDSEHGAGAAFIVSLPKLANRTEAALD